MLILDLASDINPIFSKFESYYGQPFIWCMIHNFGGINQMYGAVDSINNVSKSAPLNYIYKYMSVFLCDFYCFSTKRKVLVRLS